MVASSYLGLQASLGALGGSGGTFVIFIPLGARLYFIPSDGSPFITGGITILTGTVDSGPVEGETYGYAGLGFEYRSGGGFVFRGTAYGLFAEGEFIIWPGLYVGYAF